MAAESASVMGSPLGALWIGPWQVDRALNRLDRDGETIRIEPKAMDLLVHLAERRGQVVTREALLDAVWPGVVVGDDALTAAVIKLRKALGDTAREPAYIETIAKRGYRLIAPVANERPQGAGEAPAQPPATLRRRSLRYAAGAVLVTACIGVGAALVNRDRSNTLLGSELPPIPQPDLLQLAAQPTILVRPFDVLGSDPRQMVLARGLAADLTTDLAAASGLTVLGGPGPVQQSEGRSEAIAARYVVSGTVQYEDERLRVNVALTDTKEAAQIWSERFERDARELFAVQDDLVTRILAMLPVKISEAERTRVAQHYTRSLEAYELFHRGLIAMGARQKGENQTARDLYRRAIAIDPGFARAYAGLAMTYLMEYWHQWVEDGRGALAKALEMAETARKMDPESQEVLFVLAFVHVGAQQHAAALGVLRELVRFNPSFADAYTLIGLVQIQTGHPKEALAYMHAAMRFRPNPGYMHYYGLGIAHFFAGDLEQARRNLEEAVLRNPIYPDVHAYLAATLARAGKLDEAEWQVVEIRGIRPDFTARKWLKTHPLADPNGRELLQAQLERVGL